MQLESLVGKGLIRFGGLKRKPSRFERLLLSEVGKGLIRFGGLKRYGVGGGDGNRKVGKGLIRFGGLKPFLGPYTNEAVC